MATVADKSNGNRNTLGAYLVHTQLQVTSQTQSILIALLDLPVPPGATGATVCAHVNLVEENARIQTAVRRAR